MIKYLDCKASRPGSVPSAQKQGSMVRAAPRTRRYLLNYLRDHAEELHPYNARPQRHAEKGDGEVPALRYRLAAYATSSFPISAESIWGL